MPDQEESPVDSPPEKSKGKAIVLVIVGVVIVLGAVGVYFLLKSGAPAQAAANPAAPGETLALETFVVNLAGTSDRAYLRVGITLGLSRPLPKDKNEIPVALVRDTILSVLGSARADQLVQAEGKQQLKTALLQALKERAPQLGVEDVYFTEFLVQM